MIYSLLILSDPTQGGSAHTAAEFAHAVLQRGHSLHRVFFLDKGVLCASSSAVFPQDERNSLPRWISLAEDHGIDLVLCVTSALRQGMLDTQAAQRHDRPAATIHPAFTISGLGQLIDAKEHADRVVTFGA